MPTSAVASSTAEALRKKLDARTARVGVVGLGYVGLPLAVEFARAGFTTVGIDVDQRKVDRIGRGESYIQDVPTADVARFQRDGLLAWTTDAAVIRTLDTVNICVPTPLRKDEGPGPVVLRVGGRDDCGASSSRPAGHPRVDDLPRHHRSGRAANPRTAGARRRPGLLPRLLAERVDPGNEKWNTKNVPKVVGATPACTALAKALYSASIDTVIEVSSPKVAEGVKLLENTFRAVNIGLVNELARCATGSAPASGRSLMRPRRSRSASCPSTRDRPGRPLHSDRPVLPVVEGEGSRLRGPLHRAGRDVNGAMPHYVVDKIVDALNSRSKPVRGSSVLILGISYKRDIDDMRESPALDVMAVLNQRRARSYHDPYVATLLARDWPGGLDLHSVPLSPRPWRPLTAPSSSPTIVPSITARSSGTRGCSWTRATPSRPRPTCSSWARRARDRFPTLRQEDLLGVQLVDGSHRHGAA